MKTITSRENSAYKGWKKLAQSSRERKKTGFTLLEGMHLLLAWQEIHGLPEQVLVGETGLSIGEITQWLQDHPEAPVVVLPDAMLAELSDTETPSGILALVTQPCTTCEPGKSKDSIVLDGIQDPGNLGTLLRTAAAAGFTQVILSPDCVSAWSPKVLRAGQGAHFLLDIHEAQDLPGFLKGFTGTSIATRLDATHTLYQSQWQNPAAWIFGSEGQGVSPEVMAGAKLHITIPMPGKMESLNVGAAAAICLFETVRRRLT